jgi:hypothetical protein
MDQGYGLKNSNFFLAFIKEAVSQVKGNEGTEEAIKPGVFLGFIIISEDSFNLQAIFFQ